MSLKAKLEAVIYAAEEPVTLAQLASLFTADALAWKAERDVAFSLPLETAPETEVSVAPSDPTVEMTGLSIKEGLTVVEGETEPEPTAAPASEPGSEATELEAAELEARRLQRLREREVREILRGVLDELIAEYAGDGRGLEIREIAGGFRFGTKPEMHDSVRAFVKSLKPPLKLSLPALETLAVIAYKQPVTAPEVGEVRGVDSAGVLGSLLSRKLIATAGRKQVIGRPILYKTTREFLLRFGLKDLNELPSMEEFEKMAALELSEDAEETAEVAEQSGDLFAAPEPDLTAAAEEVEKDGPEAAEPAHAEAITPTAETSEEAAEAHTPVERQDAEEVEVEQ